MKERTVGKLPTCLSEEFKKYSCITDCHNYETARKIATIPEGFSERNKALNSLTSADLAKCANNRIY